ncbi:MAG: response regulator, partial [Campylobacterales bacterium]|nr:response regulator [Campylobacterales bacterium]
GTINLKSEPKMGSEFIIELTLPYKIDSSNQTQTVDSASDTKSLQYNAHFLVAEDVVINQKLISVMLKQKGISSTICNNGLEALQTYKEKFDTFDFVLMDINMPVMDGVQAMKQIKQFQATKNLSTPIVALTANAIKGDKERFISDGFDDYLTKPIKLNDLIEVIDKYLHHKSNISNTTLSSNTQLQPQPIQNNNKIGIEIIEQNAQKMSLPVDFYKELLSDFFNTIDTELEQLISFIYTKDQVQTKDKAHKLKGLTGNICLNNLQELFKSLEDSKRSFEEQMKTYESIIHQLTLLEDIKKAVS